MDGAEKQFGVRSFIESIQGVTCQVRRSITKIYLLAAVALGIAGITNLNLDRGISMLGLGLIALCVIMLIKSLKPTAYFGITASVGGHALETIISGQGKWFGKNNSSIVFQFNPTNACIDMMRELGACIYDLKTLGDRAITLWKK